MPRINPVPEREREIARRLRQFRREATKLSQVAFAREVGIDSSRLASYEHGRVPLPYSVFLAVWRAFKINAHWLATNDRRIVRGDDIDESLFPTPDQAVLFSETWDAHLKAHFDQAAEMHSDSAVAEMMRLAGLISTEVERLSGLSEEKKRKAQAVLARILIWKKNFYYRRNCWHVYRRGWLSPHTMWLKVDCL